MFEITVKNLKGQIYTLEVDANETCASLKHKVHEKAEIEPENQLLIHVGKPMEDDNTLASYNVSKGSNIHLIIRNAPRVRKAVETTPSSDLAQGRYQIFVKSLSGKLTTLEVEQSTTILGLKAMIHEKEGIPANQNRILFNREELGFYEYRMTVVEGKDSKGKIGMDTPLCEFLTKTTVGPQKPLVCAIDKSEPRISFQNEACDFSLAFHRTLRIPDDGKVYPLPPGFGQFPVYRVEDYPNVPATWKENGGVFIPMYQNEAMWVGFSGQYPCAVKLALGKINAISGEPYIDKLSSTPQDYMATPSQPWIDGINSGNGNVRQFVAMPLGQNLTVEAQVTEKETVGGLQIEVIPIDQKLFTATAHGEFRLPVDFTGDDNSLVRKTPRELDIKLGQVIQMVNNTPISTFASYAGEATLASYNINKDSTLHMVLRLRGGGEVPEMGISAGGKIAQKINKDMQGVDAWNLEARARCFVHIVNSEQFKQITGIDPHEKQKITKQHYISKGLPWFELYGETTTNVPAPTVLKEVKGLAELGKEKDEKSTVPQQNSDKK